MSLAHSYSFSTWPFRGVSIMLELVITSGMGRKMSPVHHDDQTPPTDTSTDHTHLTGSMTGLMTVITQGRCPVCLFVIWYHIKNGIFPALISMESWMNTPCLEVRGLPEGTPRVHWDLWFSLSSQIYSHRHLRFTSALCVWRARGSHTWAGGDKSTSSLSLLKLFNIFTAGGINGKFIPFENGSVQLNFCFSASFLRLLQRFPLLSLLFYIS